MKHKIFISLDLPEKVKKRLVVAIEKWHDLPVKWVKKQNLHITLAFLGFVDKNLLSEICALVNEASQKSNIFDINFQKIELFPSQNKPRLIALTGKSNEELKNLVNNIEKNLGISAAPKKVFHPHITLGRLQAKRWKSLNFSPEINTKFSFTLPVENVHIMASNFKNKEREYIILESCQLK